MLFVRLLYLLLLSLRIRLALHRSREQKSVRNGHIRTSVASANVRKRNNLAKYRAIHANRYYLFISHRLLIVVVVVVVVAMNGPAAADLCIYWAISISNLFAKSKREHLICLGF